MKVVLSKIILDKALRNLLLPHDFAYERVGYFLGNLENENIYIDEWFPFYDSEYNSTCKAGVEIGENGMFRLMNHAYKKKKHFFHAHIHDFQDSPKFSAIDMRSLVSVTSALFDFSERCIHGGMVIGRKETLCIFWKDRKCMEKVELKLGFGIGGLENEN
jgi:hypothetical protein